jgi:phage shock protein PspC (stress-responsive transcriptional regulator)
VCCTCRGFCLGRLQLGARYDVDPHVVCLVSVMVVGHIPGVPVLLFVCQHHIMAR